MIHNEARLRRSGLRGEADTSAHPAVELMTDEEGIDDVAPPAENFSKDSEVSEDVASCQLAEPTVDANDEAATSAEGPSACLRESH